MPTLKLGSSLSFANVNELLTETVVGGANEAVTLDLSATIQVDSAGVALILHWLRMCQSKDVEFSLHGASEQLQTLLDAYDLKEVFNT